VVPVADTAAGKTALIRQLGFFYVPSLQASDFEVIYAIVAKRNGRTAPQAMPFFSKLSLLRTAEDLMSRGFKVSLAGLTQPLDPLWATIPPSRALQ